jgi:hypothetical protein
MSHFAQIDQNNVVTQVIVIDQAEIDSGRWGDPASWVQTSYNGSIRTRFAGIGFTYDRARDAFIPPKPFPSWVFNEAVLDWVAPVPQPDGAPTYWDEDALVWKPVPPDTAN